VLVPSLCGFSEHTSQGVVAAGTFGLPGKELVFWDVHDPDEATLLLATTDE
jgi:hypothetical protein